MKKIIYLLLLLSTLTGCEDFLNEEPETAVTNNNFWKTEQDVESALHGLHYLFRLTFGDVNYIYRDRGLPFDYMNAIWSRPSNGTPNWRSTSSQLNWIKEYEVMAQCNLIIDNINRAKLEKGRHDYYLGQALCIRAYTYFYLLKTWGDVPLIKTSTDVGEKARIRWQEVADFAIEDLNQAKAMLPIATNLLDANGSSVTSKQTPSRGTAWAILAHLYAWKASLNREPELNQLAIAACDSVIADKSYRLADNIRDVCEKVMRGNSPEGIFELDYQNISDNDLKSVGAYPAFTFQKWPIVPLTTPSTRRSLLRMNNATAKALFPDLSDERRKEYFYELDYMATQPTSITQGAAYIQKWRGVITYTDGSDAGKLKTFDDNEIILRLADIILLRAELRANTGDTRGAITDLNTIRNRAKAKTYTPEEGNLKEGIALEREKELFLEFGARYYDIVRNGIFREKLKGKHKTLTDKDVSDGALYLPVGIAAFSDNTLMKQTPYWARNGYAY
ncbi:RagB/SusD family nutrient uptake outer membrane protein [Gabonibacter massiliensis]|uniref:RagB/SusD family nutrient uptake outer membrane protein n=1 Tax=Gabonibacter massiliensis TaxID=1720195 RepID=UPI00073ED022|nr:RagB/SusD family nutrient uptake outer membrane protein [Gabonibacter massiliensis]